MSNPDITAYMKSAGIAGNYAKLEEIYVQQVLNISGNIGFSYIVWQEVFDNGVKVSTAWFNFYLSRLFSVNWLTEVLQKNSRCEVVLDHDHMSVTKLTAILLKLTMEAFLFWQFMIDKLSLKLERCLGVLKDLYNLANFELATSIRHE